MPITIALTKPLPKPKTALEARERAREKFKQDAQAFIEKYCSDHSAFQRDPAAYYKAQVHEKHPGAARGFGDDGSQPRYYSPYEDGHRFRHAEAVGGYRCAPYGSDGVAVRAKGFAPHTGESGKESVVFVAHGASSKPTLPQAAMAGPIKVGGRWEYPDNQNFFAYAAFYGGHVVRAVRFTVVEPSLPALPSPRKPQIATVKTISGKADPQRAYLSNFLYGAAHVLYPSTGLKKEQAKNRILANRNQLGLSFALRPEDFPNYNPTEIEISQWRTQYWLKRRKFNCRLGRVEPFCTCPACQKWYPNLERVDWRTVWGSADDMTTRKLRDLSTRLKLYRYGDHHWQTATMGKVTAKRLYEARLRWVAACGVRPYFWPFKHENVLSVPYVNGPAEHKERTANGPAGNLRVCTLCAEENNAQVVTKPMPIEYFATVDQVKTGWASAIPWVWPVGEQWRIEDEPHGIPVPGFSALVLRTPKPRPETVPNCLGPEASRKRNADGSISPSVDNGFRMRDWMNGQ